MRYVIEFEDDSIAEVLHMYDANGEETWDRLKAEAMVAEHPCGAVFQGAVNHYEGLHPVQ